MNVLLVLAYVAHVRHWFANSTWNGQMHHLKDLFWRHRSAKAQNRAASSRGPEASSARGVLRCCIMRMPRRVIYFWWKYLLILIVWCTVQARGELLPTKEDTNMFAKGIEETRTRGIPKWTNTEPNVRPVSRTMYWQTWWTDTLPIRKSATIHKPI